MKKYMRYIVTIAALLMVSSSAWSYGNVKLYGSTSNVTYAISNAVSGEYTNVTSEGVTPSGLTNHTVYLKVTPASGYTIAKSAITVKQAVSGSNAQTRTNSPEIVGTITLTETSTANIYSFTMPNDDNINVLISGDATPAIVEEKVSTTKSWTFDDLTVGTVYSSYTAINGLYLRSVAIGRNFTVTEGELTNITFADGQPNMNVGKYLALNANALYNNDGALTATSTAGDGQTNGTGMIAINATVAGTFSVKIKGGTSGKVIRMYFANGTSVSAVKSITSDGTIQEISYTSTEAGSFFVGGITTGTSEIYAARFVPSSETVKYAFTLSQPSTGGTISAKIGNETIEGSTEVLPGAEVTLTATPADGYQIGSWKDGSNSAIGTIPQSISTTVTMPAKELTITADFKAQPSEPKSITSETVWTFDGFANGMKLSGAGTYEYNGLYIGGHSETNFSTIVAGSSAVETGISDNVTNYLSNAGGYDKDIASTVAANTYKTDAISFKAGVPGIVSVYMSGKFAEGRNFNIWTGGTKHTTAMADENATLITQSVAQGSVFIATSAGAAKIYAIKFVPATTYTLTVTQPSEGGTIKIGDAEAATQDIVENQDVTLTAVAISGYEFDYWTVDGNKDTEHTTATLTINMNAAHSVTVAFKKSVEKNVNSSKAWTFDELETNTAYNSISVFNDAYLRGSSSPNRTLTVKTLDAAQTLTFADGQSVTAAKYLESNSNFANFGQLTATSTAAATTITDTSKGLDGAGCFALNTTVPGTLYVKISSGTAGKKLRIYFADGTSIKNTESVPTTTDITEMSYTSTSESGGTFFVGGVETAYSIYAVRFVPASEAVKYTLTLTQPSAGGTIAATVNGETIEGSTEVLPGAEVTLTATPADGYQIGSWKDGSNSAIGTIPQSISTTVTMPAKELTVTADFKAQPSEPTSITSETVWTFDGFDNGMKLSGAGTYEYNGLYIGGHSETNFSTIVAGSSAVETGISDNVTNYLSLAGGYDKDIASTVAANTYKTDAISFKAGVPGIVSVYMSGKFAEGRNFNIWTGGTKHTTAMADENATLITQSVAQGSVFIATSAGAAKIYAIKFVPATTYTLTVTQPSEGGTIKIGDAEAATQDIVENQDVTLTAVAVSGYEFDYWTVDGNKDTEHTTTTLTVTMSQAHSVTAAFKKSTEKTVGAMKTWTYDSMTAGEVFNSITAINDEYYLRGSVAPNRTLTVTSLDSPEELEFADGSKVTVNQILTSNGLLANAGSADFTKDFTAGSSAQNSSSQLIASGALAFNATVAGTCYVYMSGTTASTAEKKQYLRIYFADGESLSNSQVEVTEANKPIAVSKTVTGPGTFLIASPTTAYSIYAVRFVPTSEAVKYTLTLTQPSAGGTIAATVNGETFEGSTEVLPGAEVTLTATPADGYQIGSWKDGSNSAIGTIPQSISTTVTMPAKELTVTADFKAQPSEPKSITSETVWTFDGFDNGMKLSGAGTYEYNGLYIGGHSETNFSTIVAGANAVATGISDDVTNYLSLAGGYDKDIASTVAANTYKTDVISFKAGVPGMVSVYMSGKYAEGRNFNIWTGGTKHTTAMADENATLITQGVAQGSVFIATSAGAAKIYAVKFIPETITQPTVSATDEGKVTIEPGTSSLSEKYSTYVELKTFYTIDGSEPSATNGTEYTEPFEPGSCTVKAATVNVKTGNSSDVASKEVVIQIAPSTGVPVILVAGQSNTDGRIKTTETAFPYNLSHALMSYCNGVDYTSEGSFTAYGTTPKSDSGKSWGYDAVVYDKIQTALGGNKDFYVIKQSKGNTAVNLMCAGNGQHWWSANPVWLDRNTSANQGGQSLLLALKGNIDKSLKALEDAGKEYDIKFLMWHQGEGDRGRKEQYETQLKAVINEVRNYLVERTGNNKYSNLPFILGGIASVSKEGTEEVETAKQNLAAADANVYYAPTGEMTLEEDFRSDQVHFNATGAEKIANSVWNIITTNNLMEGITIAGTDTKAENPLKEDVVSETKTFTFSTAETINTSKSIDGFYAHGVKVSKKSYGEVSFADGTTANAEYAATSGGADRSSVITERLTGGNGQYTRIFGMNASGKGTFMAIVRGTSTTDIIRLKLNGEEVQVVPVTSTDENILLTGKTTGKGSFFICNSESSAFDVLAARFVAGETTIETVTAPTIEAGAELNTVKIIPGTSDNSSATMTTYYTTDGTIPTASSTLYEGEFALSESCTVNAVTISSKGGKAYSSPYSFVYQTPAPNTDPVVYDLTTMVDGDASTLTFGTDIITVYVSEAKSDGTRKENKRNFYTVTNLDSKVSVREGESSVQVTGGSIRLTRPFAIHNLGKGDEITIVYSGGGSLQNATPSIADVVSMNGIALNAGDDIASGNTIRITKYNYDNNYIVLAPSGKVVISAIYINKEVPVDEETATNFYVSPDGDDSNKGIQKSAPFKTLKKAQQRVSSGSTIHFLPGTYKVTNDEYMDKTSDNTWNIVYQLDKDNIQYIGEPDDQGNRPVFDFSGVTSVDNKRITGFHVAAKNLVIKNIETIGINVASESGTQSENFRLNGATDCQLVNIAAHDGQGIGFYIHRKSAGNIIKNCDAYENYDKTNKDGGNNDGFGCHVVEGYEGNQFVGCRAWYNADDGFDLKSCFSKVVIEDCIAYKNGYATVDGTLTKLADGNGFKAGGFGKNAITLPEGGAPVHEVNNCISADNKASGFYSNHHLGGLQFSGNRAYHHSKDYYMINRDMASVNSTIANATDPEMNVAGYGHILLNNLSYNTTTSIDGIDVEKCTVAGNSFKYANGTWANDSYTESDFVSLDLSLLTKARKTDGSLADDVFNFMLLKDAGEAPTAPSWTESSKEMGKVVYTVQYPSDAELHYILPGTTEEKTTTEGGVNGEGLKEYKIEVTESGDLKLFTQKGGKASDIVTVSVTVPQPTASVTYNFVQLYKKNKDFDLGFSDASKTTRYFSEKADDGTMSDKNGNFYAIEAEPMNGIISWREKSVEIRASGLKPTSEARPFAIHGLLEGDIIRIEFSGDIYYAKHTEKGDALEGLTPGEAITSTAAYTVSSVDEVNGYVMFYPTKATTISQISINQEITSSKANKPTISDPVENEDGSKTYTVTFNKGETLYYSAPDKDGEQSVDYEDSDNGSYQITVTKSGALICWTTLVGSTDKSEEAKVTVALAADEPTEKITIHTIGDSTMSSYDQSIPAQAGMDGWGDYLIDCMKTEWVTVYNWADRGEGAKSYFNGIWSKTSTDRPEFGEAVMNKVKAGDYVIIQFGHNDSKAYDTSTYEEWMGKLVDAVKANGATPIIASSICRRRFGSDGEITKLGQINPIDENDKIPSTPVTGDEHEYDYPYHAKKVAEAKGIEFIDVTAGTKELYEYYGDKKSAAFFPSGEKTHTNKLGAQTIAKVAARLLYEGNTALMKYVNTDALTLPDKETLEVVVESFGNDDVVTKRTVWTFNDYTEGSTIANDVVSLNGLYARGAEDALITAVTSSPVTSVKFSDEASTSVSVLLAAQVAANRSGAGSIGQNTAGRTSANALKNTFALNVGTPGTFYAMMAPMETGSGNMRLLFSGVEKVSIPVATAFANDNHLCELSFHAETTGVIYLCAGAMSNLYAAMFVPDMEKGTEEDWNYQMVLTRSEGYWTYTNLSGGNQSVPDGLTVYAVTAIDANGRATLADIGKVIPAGGGFLVKGDPNTEYALLNTTESSNYTGTNLMVPNDELRFLPATENGKTNYYFNGIKFVKSTGSETIHEKQAYLSVSAATEVIPLDIPEPEVTPPYGTYDFRKFAVENVSANTDKITAEKDANGILTGTFTSTAEDITISGSMTLNDAFSVTGSKAANVKMRKNGSAVTNTSSGLFINKSQATLNLLKLKAGDWFKIEYEGGLTFASTNVKKQGSTVEVVADEALSSGEVYVVQSDTEVSLNFGNSTGASYIFSVIISEDAMTPNVSFKEVTSEGKAVYTITSLDGNALRYTLGGGEEQKPSGSSVDVTVSEKTTLKAWAVNGAGSAGIANEVELLSTPVVLSDGVFDFKNKLSSLESNVSLTVDDNAVLTTTYSEKSFPLYKPALNTAATFAGVFAFSKPTTSSTALRSNQFHINTAETDKTFFMAILNVTVGTYLTIADGNKQVSKVYVGEKELTYGTPFEILNEDLTDGNLILRFDLTEGSASIQSISFSEPIKVITADLYISPEGLDDNTGTSVDKPLRTLMAAQEKAKEGYTIAILPGTYTVTNSEYMDKTDKTWNIVYNLSKKDVKYIGVIGTDGKRPVFDFTEVTPEDGKRITGFYLKTSGITIENIEAIGINIPKSESNVQSENFRLNGASDCLIKNVAAHHGKGIGFYLTGNTKNCIIEDCDAYENIDDINSISSKGQPAGENNDGFGAHVNANCPGNMFIRCRAWYNADDGFDLINCYSAVTIEDCIAYHNGYATYTNTVTGETKLARSGNGNGFKAGGYGMSKAVTLPDGVAPVHMVKNCIAASNPQGFYANHHLGGLIFEGNRAYKNSLDFKMTNRKGTGVTGNELKDVPGYEHVLTNNLVHGNTDISKIIGDFDMTKSAAVGNSFTYTNDGWTVNTYSDGDFVHLKQSVLHDVESRDEEGNLSSNVFDFMKLNVPIITPSEPTITLSSKDGEKAVFTIAYPADTELHYMIPGVDGDQTSTEGTVSGNMKVLTVTVTYTGCLKAFTQKDGVASETAMVTVTGLSEIDHSLQPIAYDFANTSDNINADDGTQKRNLTYVDQSGEIQKDVEFRYVLNGTTPTRLLTFKNTGKFTKGSGVYLNGSNRPFAIEGLSEGDVIRIVHNGTVKVANDASTGSVLTDYNGNVITDEIISGQLLKVSTISNDYAVFLATTSNLMISQLAINHALSPVVEKDSEASDKGKQVYHVSFYEGETLHYTSPDEDGEKTVAYTGSKASITVTKEGSLVCWTTIGDTSSDMVTKTIDMSGDFVEIKAQAGWQTYFAEKALDFSNVSKDAQRAYIVKKTSTASTRAMTRDNSTSQMELVEVTKVPAKTALILWAKKTATVEIPQAAQTTVAITQVDGTEVNATVNLLKKAVKTEHADANETYFVPNTDGELNFEYSSFVTRNGIYIEIPTSVVGEDAKEITLGEPQDDGTIVPLETAVAAIKNITPILDSEKSDKSKKVYLFKFDSSLKLYYKRPGQDTEFRAQSYKEEYKDGYPVSSSNSGYLEYYVMKDKESSRTDAQEIVLAPKATRTNLDKSSATYEISFFDGATLYYTLGNEAEKSTDEGSPLELTVTKGVKITAYSKTKAETTESLSTNLYAPTPSIVNDSVYGFANIKEEIGIDYVLTTTGYEEEKLTLGNVELYKPNALTSQTLDIFAFSAPRADGKGETSDWRLLNAGRLRAAKSEVDKHLLIQGAKKGNMLLLTYSGASVMYVESLSTAKLAEGTSSISSNTKYEVLNDGDILLKIAADANNNCDITVISLSSKYNPSSSGGSSSSSDDDKKTSSTAAVTIALDRVSDGIAYYSFTWESGAEMRYTLDDDETELSAGTSGSYIMEVSEGVKVKCWTVTDGKASKTVSSNLFPPTSAMAVDGNYDFAEPSDELFADMPITLDMDKKVMVEGQALYLPNALTYETFKDRFAFSELAKTSTLRMRKNRTLAFAKGEDVLMGILNLKAGDIVAFDYTGIIQIVNSGKVKEETSSSRTRGAGNGSQMVSGESYVVLQDCDLLLNVVLEDTTAIINKMYVGAVPGRSDSKAIDFVTAGEEFESLEFGRTSSVYIYNKEKAVNFKWLENESNELPIDHKISTEGGNGVLSTSGLTAGNRRIAIYDLGVGDKIKLRFSGGSVTYEGHETNGNVVSINGRRLTPQDTLQTGDIITVDKLNYLYNYMVLKLDSKVSVSGIYINSEENEKVWMPTIVDKGNNTVLITAGQSSLGNKVTTCYTTDGSEPTRTNGTSGPYDEFDVQLLKGGIVTIKAVSFTEGGVYSRVAELTIFADDLIGGGNAGSAGTRRATGTYDMQGNKVEAVRNGKLYIRDGKVVFFGVEK